MSIILCCFHSPITLLTLSCSWMIGLWHQWLFPYHFWLCWFSLSLKRLGEEPRTSGWGCLSNESMDTGNKCSFQIEKEGILCERNRNRWRYRHFRWGWATSARTLTPKEDAKSVFKFSEWLVGKRGASLFFDLKRSSRKEKGEFVSFPDLHPRFNLGFWNKNLAEHCFTSSRHD